MKKNKLLKDIFIQKVGYHGVGLSTTQEGKKIIVSGGALPQSIVDIKILKEKKDYIQGQILKIKSISKDIKISKDLCDHNFFDKSGNIKNDDFNVGCGGCKWQIIDYSQQLDLKKEIVKDSFRFIHDYSALIEDIDISASPLALGYRNKIEYSFGKYLVLDKESKEEKKFKICKNWNLGFHKQGEFSKIVDVSSCLLVSKKVNDVYFYIKNLLLDSGLPVYDQKVHNGFFRHLAIRQGVNTDQLLVNLSVSDKYFNESADGGSKLTIWKKLKSKLETDQFIKSNVTTFVINYNSGLADIIKSKDSYTENLFGDGYIFEKLEFGVEQVTFRISPFSFFQTNTLGAQLLFSKAYEMLGKVSGNCLDLYCGTGTIGLSFMKQLGFNKLLGVDIVESSINDALYNAKINGLSDRVKFLCGKAEELLLDETLKADINDVGVIIVDPPREGLHKNVVEFLLDFKKIQDYKLLYISCNPVTMARDVKMLIDGGFTLSKLHAVDMFPGTNHIETIGIIQ